MPAGTLLVSDFNQWDLAVSPQNPSVIDFGEQKVTEAIMERERIHSAQLVQVTSALGFWTTEYQLAFGGYDRGQGYEVGELGRAKPSKGGAGYFCGLPLREWQYGWQGSYRFFKQASVRLVGRNAYRMLNADAAYVMARVLDAVFNPVNYEHTDDITREGVIFPSAKLQVKALVNADGLELPPGPNGERFDAATHTHYAAEAGFTAPNLSATVATVRHHTPDSRPVMWINPAQSTAIAAFSSNFVPLSIAGLIQPDSGTRVAQTLDVGNPGNRLIGWYDNIPVFEVPQIPANYILVYESNTDVKVVGIRYSDVFGGRNLQPLVQDEVHPLRATTFSRYIGMGVWNRTGAAVLQINKGDGVYAAPTFADLAA